MTILLRKASSASSKMSRCSHYAYLFFFDKQFFMALEINALLCVNNTSEKSLENKLFDPFNFQKITGYESNGPDLNLFNDQFEAVSSAYYTIDVFSSVSNTLELVLLYF